MNVNWNRAVVAMEERERQKKGTLERHSVAKKEMKLGPGCCETTCCSVVLNVLKLVLAFALLATFSYMYSQKKYRLVITSTLGMTGIEFVREMTWMDALYVATAIFNIVATIHKTQLLVIATTLLLLLDLVIVSPYLIIIGTFFMETGDDMKDADVDEGTDILGFGVGFFLNTLDIPMIIREPNNYRELERRPRSGDFQQVPKDEHEPLTQNSQSVESSMQQPENLPPP